MRLLFVVLIALFFVSSLLLGDILQQRYAMPAALRVHYHPDSLPQLQSRGQIALRRANSVPVFANNGIDWWIGQQTSSGRQRVGGTGLVAAQVGARLINRWSQVPTTGFPNTNTTCSQSVSQSVPSSLAHLVHRLHRVVSLVVAGPVPGLLLFPVRSSRRG